MSALDDQALIARIDELETRLTFQEETIAKLDDALSEQQQQLLDVQRALSMLTTRLSEVETDQGATSPEPPPPHY